MRTLFSRSQSIMILFCENYMIALFSHMLLNLLIPFRDPTHFLHLQECMFKDQKNIRSKKKKDQKNIYIFYSNSSSSFFGGG